MRLALIIGAAAAAFGFSGGWISRDAFADAAQTKSLRTSIDLLVSRENELRDGIQVRAANDIAHAREMAEQARLFNTNIRNLSDEVSQVAEVRAGLNLSAGYVSLLNDAIAGIDRSSDVPDPSGQPPYSDPEASAVGFDELTRWQLATVNQYEDAWRQCNALIKWADDNLVTQQED